MDEDSLLIIVAAAVIGIWIFHSIIRSASRASAILKQQEIQTRLLEEIARKNGVSEERIAAAKGEIPASP